jgi:protein MpaA
VLLSHRCHDYDAIRKRLREIARKNSLALGTLAQTAGDTLYSLTSRPGGRQPRVFLSAGIHGDEAGAVEALLCWLESRPAWLETFAFSILPAINPWGLVRNLRVNEDGIDLNRSYHLDSVPVVRAARRYITAGAPYDLAVLLHEDYDAQGLYLYELTGRLPSWGEDILKAAAKVCPIETRSRIDGRRHRNGVVQRKITPAFFRKMGLPEAGYLFFNHCPRVFTIETPSEFGLDVRVRAHGAALEAALRQLARAKTGPAPKQKI